MLPSSFLLPNDCVFVQVLGKINVECASYSVLKTLGNDTELRRYSACVAAETPCSRMDGRDGAFGRLASYIGCIITQLCFASTCIQVFISQCHAEFAVYLEHQPISKVEQ
jgi:hypothetical protein